MRRFWPTIRSLASYWEALHSWALMSPGAREAGEMYHGDMPTAGFAGLVGFHKLAQRLGTPYQRDLAACLMTKASIPMITKFGFGDYLRPFGIAASGNPLCTGFGECWVASFQSPTPTVSNMASRDPWWVTGCIGPQSAQTETMDLYMKGCHRDVDAFETTVRRLCPDREFAAHRPENVMPHLMLRTFLGDPLRQNAATFLDGYCSEYLMRDAHVVSGLLAWDCPVRLEDWYPAFVKTAAWTAADGARIVLDASAPATVRLILHASLPSPVCQVDGVAVPVTALDAWNGWQRVELAVPKGTHEIRVVGGR